jgi:hypothetical protein
MIRYPPDLSEAARAAIERAIAEAEGVFAAETRPVRQTLLAGPITYVGMHDSADEAVLFYVLDVFEAIARIACEEAIGDSWPPDRLRMATEDWLAQLIEAAYREKHSQVAALGSRTAEQFTADVHRELRALDVWSDLQRTIARLATVAVVEEDDSGSGSESEAARATRRRALLQAYKRATGIASDKRIYESDAPIHKPQFYDWRKGKLPESSATAENFERFLLDGIRNARQEP